MKKLTQTILATALMIGAFTANAQANYVVDGDFSNPYGGSSFTNYGTGQNFSAWNVVSGNVDLIGGFWQSPSSGPNAGSVDMDGSTPGSISQTLSTGPGSFLLSFSLSGNPFGGDPLKSLSVSVGNVIGQLFTYTTGTNTTGNMQYATETLLFNSAAATTNLVFSSLDSAGSEWGPAIGKVTVNAVSSVPLPAGLPMFVAALLAMAGFQSFRKRQAA